MKNANNFTFTLVCRRYYSFVMLIQFQNENGEKMSQRDEKEAMLGFFIKHNNPYSLFNKDMYRGCNKKISKGYTQVTYPIWMKAIEGLG